MRNAILFSLSLVLLSCGNIAPIESVDLCRGDTPPSDDCAQCMTAPYAAGCPKCRRGTPDPKCENADGGGMGTGGRDGGGAGAGSGGAGSGGAGGAAGTGGAGGANGSGGFDGGSGGRTMSMDAGPDAMVDAGPSCGPCPAHWTMCTARNECAQCLSDRSCLEADAPYCDTDGTHGCVGCLKDEQCPHGKVCDANAHACVECSADSDCSDPKKPQCNANTCSACTSQSACTGRDGFGSCDQEKGSATLGQCVQCLVHSDCNNPTPQCNAKRQCVPCSGDDAACTGRDGTTVCDLDDWSSKKGTCVQCTGEEYAPCKVGSTEYVCDSLNRTCSTDVAHKKAATGVCGSCISDAECQTGMKCVDMQFGSPAKDVGWFCQWEESATGAGAPGGTCANARPFFKTSPLLQSDPEVVSIDRENVTICTLAVSTCPAFIDFRSAAIDCNTGTAQSPVLDDGRCGFDYSANPTSDEASGNQDAYCALAATATYRCTMRCLTDDDCISGVTCNTTTHRCNLQ
jgi:hypothetical protein